MQQVFCGVDPGKTGAYAVIKYGEIYVRPWDIVGFVRDMKGIALAASSLRWPVTAYVEDVHAMPGQGVTSMFNFGKSAGFIHGALAGLGIPFQLVSPRKWKQEFGLSGGDPADSVAVAERLFPGVSLMATPRSRKPSDGMAEALLIAEYCRRRTAGGERERKA
ncbi:MAG: hypothetical protein LBS45_12285 [Synergistaceae bacterium]|nr:hypothetical protein [Synergistaceae bacterium]